MMSVKQSRTQQFECIKIQLDLDEEIPNGFTEPQQMNRREIINDSITQVKIQIFIEKQKNNNIHFHSFTKQQALSFFDRAAPFYLPQLWECVGFVCLMLSTKLNEVRDKYLIISEDDVQKIVRAITRVHHSHDFITELEQDIIKKLGYKLINPLPIKYLDYFLSLLEVSEDEKEQLFVYWDLVVDLSQAISQLISVKRIYITIAVLAFAFNEIGKQSLIQKLNNLIDECEKKGIVLCRKTCHFTYQKIAYFYQKIINQCDEQKKEKENTSDYQQCEENRQ